MKGVVYNLSVKVPESENVVTENMKIDELMETLKNQIKEYYNVDMKISKHMVYNLVYRPNMANRFVRQVCDVQIIKKKKEISS